MTFSSCLTLPPGSDTPRCKRQAHAGVSAPAGNFIEGGRGSSAPGSRGQKRPSVAFAGTVRGNFSIYSIALSPCTSLPRRSTVKTRTPALLRSCSVHAIIFSCWEQRDRRIRLARLSVEHTMRSVASRCAFSFASPRSAPCPVPCTLRVFARPQQKPRTAQFCASERIKKDVRRISPTHVFRVSVLYSALSAALRPL